MTSIAEQQFPGVPASVAASRRFVAGQLAEPGLARVAALCVGELAANAIRHSRSGGKGGTFRVVVEAAPEWTRVEVVDQDGDGTPSVRPASDDAVDGRGLQIGDGHCVWVRIKRIARPDGSTPTADELAAAS